LDVATEGGFELGLVGFVPAFLLPVGADALGVTYLPSNQGPLKGTAF
jgi:membrane protein YqaA with SNARE-associated domain